MKRKVIALLMTVAVSATLLAGCGGGDDGGNASLGNSDGANSSQDADGGEDEGGSEDAEQADGDEIVIKYGGWEGNIMIRELAEKFEETHPGVRIEFTLEGWNGTDKLTELAATGELPDIVNLQEIVTPVQNDWVIDLKPYLDNDPDSASLPESMLKYGTVGDKVIMLPGSMFLFGVAVNKDLLSSYGLDIPDYNWTVDEFVDIVKKTTKAGSSVGLSEVQPLLKHIPPQMNDALGWGSFNEETREYDLGEEYAYAVSVAKDIMDANAAVYERLDALGIPWDFEEGSTERQEIDDARANFVMDLMGETDAWTGFLKGKMACFMAFTYDVAGLKDNPDYSGFDWDFYPVPGSGENPRTPIVVDSIAITTTCEHPQEAYEFVKFISFSEEGIQARIDIVKNQDMEALKAKYPDRPEADFAYPLVFNQMPVTTNQALIDEWAELNDAKPGISYLLGHLDNGYVDGYKVTPGFDEAYHNTIQKAVREQVLLTGEKSFSDIVDEIQARANEITKEAYSAIGE